MTTRIAPGTKTWSESSTDWVSAVRTVATRTSCDALAYRSAKTSSPPKPRSTRRPTTVSAAKDDAPARAERSAVCRRSRGRMTGRTNRANSGAPTTSTSPSRTDEANKSAATVK